MTILVADDTTTIRRFIKGALQDLGFQKIYEAKDGKDALDLLNNYEIDCIISDWEMPELTGLELLKHVRNDIKYQNCPFVMVTSVAEKENVISAAKENVTGYITKPFTTEGLISRLTQYIPKNLKSQTKDIKKDKKDIEVLLVDNNNLMRRLVNKYLVELNFKNIFEAKTYNEAVNYLEKKSIGMVISTWESDNISGLNLLKKVRSSQKLKNIPFLAMTNNISKEDAVKAKNEKISALISTPFKIEALKEKIDKIL